MKTINIKNKQKRSFQADSQIDNVNNNGHHSVKKLLSDALNHQKKKQLVQANLLYQQVLKQEPENICALNALGLIALETGMFVLASEFFNFAHLVEPSNTTVNKNLGLVYTKLPDYNKAIQHYSYILDADEKNAEVHGELARLYLQKGDATIAFTHYKHAFKYNPADPRNFQGIVQLNASAVSEQELNIVENYLLQPNLSLEVRSSFYFSLGAVYDISEKYDEAFASYSVANAAKAVSFDADIHVEYISDIIQSFPSEFFEQQKAHSLNNSTQPIFIVGMPQSGITSIDQLLKRHSAIYAAGELNYIENIARKLNATTDTFSVENINDEFLSEFSKLYLNQTNALALDDNYKVPAHIIDKKSSNFLYLGLIALLFPKAKIIHCVANPLDICLSNYFNNYSSDNRYAYDQKNIALYYQQYERLMTHWNNVLPVDIHTINYDDMMKSPEAISRKLFDFINIEWQQQCVEHASIAQDKSLHKSKSESKNESAQLKYAQNKSQAQHWQKYRKYVYSLMQDLTTLNVEKSSTEAANVQ